VNLRQLEAFQAVMRTGSVTNAAASLYLSQPAVSRLIAELERSVGFRLFERIKGSTPVPTPEAEAFFQEVQRSFAGLQVLRQAAADIKNYRTGNLRVACLPALATGFVPTVIKEFRAANPAVRIQLQTRSSSTVRLWVAAQQFDLGLATPAGEVQGAHAESFIKIPGVCVLPAGHSLAARDTITPADLRSEPFISLALEDPVRPKIDRVFEDAGVERDVVVETQYAVTVCGLVKRGVGCAILNPLAVADFVELGLVMRPFHPVVEFEYMLYLPTFRPPSRLAIEFIELLKQTRDRLVASSAAPAPTAGVPSGH
jgi:DNA-binding transcriptional LysR family regulator